MNASQQVPVKQGGAVQPRVSMFGSLQREIDRLFEDFAPSLAFGAERAPARCKMDLAETKEGLELTVEVPGLDEKDVQVSVSEGELTVSGEKRFEKEEQDKSYHFVERSYGAFSRSIQLPAGVKADDIKATLEKGVLKVSVPTPAKPQPQKIDVKAAS
jgi:HSP20 family protein